MQNTFSISVPADTRTLHPKRDGKVEVTYTVTNSKSNPARARVRVTAKDGANDAWFTISGDAERNVGAEESQQYKVLVAIPPDTPEGTYGFRIDAINVANPQEDFAEGDTISVQWEPAAAVPAKRNKWLIPAIAASAVLLVIVAAVISLSLLLRDGSVTIPSEVIGNLKQAASEKLSDKDLKVAPEVKYDFDREKAPNVVVSTDPAAGKEVEPGTEVTLTLNLPIQLSQDFEQAQGEIQAIDFDAVKQDGFDPTKDLNAVLAAEVDQAAKSVVLTVNRYSLIPDTVGETLADATEILNGFDIVTQDGVNRRQPLNVVLATEPPPGAKVDSGGEKRIVVTINSQVAVPSGIVGANYDEVAPTLENLGLPVLTTEGFDAGKELNTVLEIDPPVGTFVGSGAQLVVTLNKFIEFPQGIIGDTLSSAQDKLKELTVSVKAGFDMERQYDEVLNANVTPGTRMKLGANVELTRNALALVATQDLEQAVYAIGEMAFDRDGRYLAVDELGRGLHYWQVSTEGTLTSRNLLEEYQVKGFSADGKLLATMQKRKDAVFWSTHDLLEKDRIRPEGVGIPFGKEMSLAAALRPGQQTLQMVTAWYNSAGDQLVTRLWSVGDRRQIRDFELSAKTSTGLAESIVKVSPDGNKLAAVAQPYTPEAVIHVWDLRNASTPERRFRVPTSNIYPRFYDMLNFSPGGDFLATASTDKTILLWDVAGDARVKTLKDKVGTGGAVSPAFSPDGTWLAAVGCNNLLIWDLQAGEDLAHEVKFSDAPPTNGSTFAAKASFSPCGTWLAVANATLSGGRKLRLRLFQVGNSK